MPSVQDFMAVVKQKGLARTEKFRVQITAPNSVTSMSNAQQTVNLFCEEASLPGITIGTKQARIHNLSIQRPSTVDYGGDAISLTFLVDGSWDVKKYFDTWMDKIIDRNREVAEYLNIIGTLEIHAVHEGSITGVPATAYQENTRYAVRLREVFPKSMQVMPMAHGTIGIHRLNMQFAYKYWETIK